MALSKKLMTNKGVYAEYWHITDYNFQKISTDACICFTLAGYVNKIVREENAEPLESKNYIIKLDPELYSQYKKIEIQFNKAIPSVIWVSFVIDYNTSTHFQENVGSIIDSALKSNYNYLKTTKDFIDATDI